MGRDAIPANADFRAAHRRRDYVRPCLAADHAIQVLRIAIPLHGDL
jgi:hypothetical protein